MHGISGGAVDAYFEVESGLRLTTTVTYCGDEVTASDRIAGIQVESLVVAV